MAARPSIQLRLVNEAMFSSQSVIQRRPLVGTERIEVGHGDSVKFEECERGIERIRCFPVIAKHKIQGVADAPLAEVGEDLFILVHLVELLVHSRQNFTANTFHAHIHMEQTRFAWPSP